MTKTMSQTDDETKSEVRFKLPGFLHRAPKEAGAADAEAPAPADMRTSWQALQTIVGVALLVATVFTIWTPNSLLSRSLSEKMLRALSAQNLSQNEVVQNGLPAGFPVNKIGIVVGHRGNDSGSVCANGMTEVEINSTVATFVQKKLVDAGYDVELLDEYDPRLSAYRAGLLLSIHSDSCDYIADSSTGFKMAAGLSETGADTSSRLVSCMAQRYQEATGLTYHYQSITSDMVYYHAFSEVDPLTPAGIIEIGFMNLDYKILTEEPEKIADGIVAGISCFLNNESIGDEIIEGVNP